MIQKAWVSFKQDNLLITLTEFTKLTESIKVVITQEQSVRLKAGIVYIQLRALMTDGTAIATAIKSVKVEDILQEGVIS